MKSLEYEHPLESTDRSTDGREWPALGRTISVSNVLVSGRPGVFVERQRRRRQGHAIDDMLGANVEKELALLKTAAEAPAP